MLGALLVAEPTVTTTDLAVGWVACGLLAGFIGWSKGRSPVLSFVVGFLFGCIALVVMVLVPRRRRL